MSRHRAIVYCVTSHGYGHLNRAAAVVDAIPRRVPVIVKTHRNLFERWQESVRRPCELVEGVFDCGAVHPEGESSLVDPVATLAKYRAVHTEAKQRLADEIRFLRKNRCGAVVTDIAPLPLRAAREAGIPGILVANFTWHDIFTPYARTTRPAYRDMLDTMRDEYHMAHLVLRAQPAIPSNSLPRIKDVGLVTRIGRNRRGELLRLLGLPPNARLVYLYIGRYGQHDIDWENLVRLPAYQFLSYHTPPSRLANFHTLDPRNWPPRDLAASVHIMVAKAGYGTVTDAMVNGTPLVFPPRFGFAEHRYLARGLVRWGGGVPVRTRDFKEFRLRRALEIAEDLRPGGSPWPRNGAALCAREILKVVRSGN